MLILNVLVCNMFGGTMLFYICVCCVGACESRSYCLKTRFLGIWCAVDIVKTHIHLYILERCEVGDRI